jgi:hypothetical protein
MIYLYSMTISTRNRILTILTLFIFSSLFYSIWLFIDVSQDFDLLHSEPFFFVTVRSGILLVTPLISLIGFFRYFQKITGILIFFFFVSIATMVFEATSILGYLSYLSNAPLDQLIWFSRVRLFGMALGAFSLFATSVYISGINYQNQGTVLLVLVGISFIIAQMTPLATANPGISHLFPPTLARELGFVYGIIIILTFLNFLKSSLINQNIDELVIGASLVGIMIGRWFVNTSESWIVLGIGSVLMILGIGLYSKRVFALYLWY